MGERQTRDRAGSSAGGSHDFIHLWGIVLPLSPGLVDNIYTLGEQLGLCDLPLGSRETVQSPEPREGKSTQGWLWAPKTERNLPASHNHRLSSQRPLGNS